MVDHILSALMERFGKEVDMDNVLNGWNYYTCNLAELSQHDSIMSDISLIGPHEGREIELMLAGEKPLALFSCFVDDVGIIPSEQFDGYVANGRLIKREWDVKMPTEEGMPPFRHVLLALPNEAWRLGDAYDILNHHEGDPRRHSDNGHSNGPIIGLFRRGS